MRILYASHKGLPDQRIEREAYLAKAAGHKVMFLGMGGAITPQLDVFEDIIMLRSINNRQAVLDKSIRNEWAKAVEHINPDIVHAGDIIAAKYTSQTGRRMVYDDHEYWSAQRIIYGNWPLWKRIAIRPFLKVIPKWEQALLEKYVTITVSEGIAKQHRKYCKNVIVLRNYSLMAEVKGLPINPKRDGVAYVGNDLRRPKFAPHRNMAGLKGHLEFDELFDLPRDELYRRLTRYRFGLLPFKTTKYTEYISSTRTFDYLNCGLQVLMTRPLFESHGRLPYCYHFDDYPDISKVINRCERVDPAEIMEYANKNLVWETQKDKLFEAYELCMAET